MVPSAKESPNTKNIRVAILKMKLHTANKRWVKYIYIYILIFQPTKNTLKRLPMFSFPSPLKTCYKTLSFGAFGVFEQDPTSSKLKSRLKMPKKYPPGIDHKVGEGISWCIRWNQKLVASHHDILKQRARHVKRTNKNAKTTYMEPNIFPVLLWTGKTSFNFQTTLSFGYHVCVFFARASTKQAFLHKQCTFCTTLHTKNIRPETSPHRQPTSSDFSYKKPVPRCCARF